MQTRAQKNTKPRQQAQHSFPLLKNDEIIQCLQELGLTTITITQIQEPNKEIARNIYYLFLELCMGCTKDQLDNLNDDILYQQDSLAFPELYDDALLELYFINKITTLMKVCGVSDFGVKDLYPNNEKRFRRHLSALINFAKFREDRIIEAYTELKDERKKIFQYYDEAELEREELTYELSQLQAESTQQQTQLSKSQANRKQIEEELKKQNELQVQLRQESSQLKQQYNTLKEQQKFLELNIQEVTAEEQRLLSQVVSSPDRIVHQLNQCKDEFERERQACIDAQEEGDSYVKMCHNVKRAINEVLKLKDIVVECIKELNRKKKIEKEVEEWRCKINLIQKELNDSKKISVSEEERYQRNVKRSAQMEKEHLQKKQVLIQQLEQARMDLQSFEHEQSEASARVDAAQLEVANAEKSIAKKREDYEMEIENMLETFDRFVEEIIVYERQVLNKL